MSFKSIKTSWVTEMLLLILKGKTYAVVSFWLIIVKSVGVFILFFFVSNIFSIMQDIPLLSVLARLGRTWSHTKINTITSQKMKPRCVCGECVTGWTKQQYYLQVFLSNWSQGNRNVHVLIFSSYILKIFIVNKQDLDLSISRACYSSLSLGINVNSGSLNVLFYSHLEHFLWYCNLLEFELLS